MRAFKLFVGTIIFCALVTTPIYAQSGDQNNESLTSVPDIQVETIVGYLPRLPRYIQGVYSNKIEGPDVRVLWPAPVDNSQVDLKITIFQRNSFKLE